MAANRTRVCGGTSGSASNQFRRDKLTRRANQFWFSEFVSSPEIRNISLFQKPNQGYIFDHPVLLRRASAVVTDVGRVAVDAEVATDDSQLERTAKARGPDTPLLVSSS